MLAMKATQRLNYKITQDKPFNRDITPGPKLKWVPYIKTLVKSLSSAAVTGRKLDKLMNITIGRLDRFTSFHILYECRVVFYYEKM